MWEKIKKAYKSLTKDSEIVMGATLDDIIERNSFNHSLRVKTLISHALNSNMPVEEFSKKLKDINNKQRNNIKYRIKDIINAGQQRVHTLINEMKEEDKINKGYVYEAKNEACKICRPKHGKKWEKWADIPYIDRPLIHYNCYCVILPITSDGAFNALNRNSWIKLQTKKVQNIIKNKADIAIETFKKYIKV